jgi:hypothetical protein
VSATRAAVSPESRVRESAEAGGTVRHVALRRPEHPQRVALVAVVLLIVVNLAIFGTRKEVRGTAAPPTRPAIIEQISPEENELVLGQSSVVVDLKPTYTAQLSIDGRPIPDDQVTVERDVYEISFQPTPDHDIHRFAAGPHTVTLEYWPRTKTYDEAKAGRLLSSYSWNFKVE